MDIAISPSGRSADCSERSVKYQQADVLNNTILELFNKKICDL